MVQSYFPLWYSLAGPIEICATDTAKREILNLFHTDPTMQQGILKEGSIPVPLTSCLTYLDYSVLEIKTKIVSCHTADSKPVKQEVNGTVILPPLVFPGWSNRDMLY